MLLCANPLAQYESHRAEIESAVLRVMRGGHYILGAEVEALEREFAAFIGTDDAIGVANGTDAVALALRALGIGFGDEVISVSQTAVATIAAIESTGARAVVVDVEPQYYTIDPRKLEEARSARTAAVVAVHLFGQAADLGAIGAFCQKHHLALVEDAAQAHGARWQGQRLGSVGVVGCFSCYPTKNLGAIGDGGLVTTSDGGVAARIRMLRQYGWRERYTSAVPGYNSRLDELQAAVLRVKLRYLDEDNSRRRAIADQYSDHLAHSLLATPQVRPDSEHVFHLYVVRTAVRDALLGEMRRRDIMPGVHYPAPVHLQPAYEGRLRVGSSMHVTESLARETLSLPMYPELSDREVDVVVDVVEQSLAEIAAASLVEAIA